MSGYTKLMHDLTVNCITGSDVNTKLCGKVRHIYTAYCPHNEICIRLLMVMEKLNRS